MADEAKAWSDEGVWAIWKSTRCEHANSERTESTYACPARVQAFARAVAAKAMEEAATIAELSSMHFDTPRRIRARAKEIANAK